MDAVRKAVLVVGVGIVAVTSVLFVNAMASVSSFNQDCAHGPMVCSASFTTLGWESCILLWTLGGLLIAYAFVGRGSHLARSSAPTPLGGLPPGPPSPGTPPS
jgi:hypothetical protein